MGVYTLPKKERLTNFEIINRVFSKSGKPFFYFPLLLTVIPFESPTECGLTQILVSVSKKKIKKATDRNLIRRRVKEAYRLNKHIQFKQNNSPNRNFALGIIYLSKEIEPYEKINKSIKHLLHEFYKNHQ